jgi:hypothetical protein
VADWKDRLRNLSDEEKAERYPGGVERFIAWVESRPELNWSAPPEMYDRAAEIMKGG